MSYSNLDNRLYQERWQRWTDMPWLIVEPGKRAEARMPLGTYVVDVRPDNKSYVLRFIAEAGERVCPTRFTANNRVQIEAEDHHRRLLAQQEQPAHMKPPKW